MFTSPFLKSDQWPKLYLPLFLEKISAGFPSPAQDYVEQRLDLNQLCVKRPAATYFVRVAGIDTALKLADVDPAWIKKQFNVVLERTVRELNGQSCLKLDDVAPIKKQIISSRSFGERIIEKHVMREAIGSYAARATEKLRQQKQFARSLTVFIRTSPFSETEPYYSNAATYQFPIPTDDTSKQQIVDASARHYQSQR